MTEPGSLSRRSLITGRWHHAASKEGWLRRSSPVSAFSCRRPGRPLPIRDHADWHNGGAS